MCAMEKPVSLWPLLELDTNLLEDAACCVSTCTLPPVVHLPPDEKSAPVAPGGAVVSSTASSGGLPTTTFGSCTEGATLHPASRDVLQTKRTSVVACEKNFAPACLSLLPTPVRTTPPPNTTSASCNALLK
ncbi:unnamed protein product, partial [Amoebophrya sp. A120]|eukprot:GSA120T00006054001.1